MAGARELEDTHKLESLELESLGRAGSQFVRSFTPSHTSSRSGKRASL